ncbi:hypothetical protein [Raineyella sp. W15-4]|nr:hypothetical protein [Raineyella sp. W15-4]WOQ15600.1 hypothetical protein R0145_10130 [Raineyella sp. W15-4]
MSTSNSGSTDDSVITSYAKAPAKTITVGGDTFAYRFITQGLGYDRSRPS